MFYGVSSNTMSGSTFGVSNGMANPALSFATVTDIRDTDIRVQPQVLLNNMNGWGLVDKQMALYPFVSDGYIEERATQHKYNLMNPADTDAAFRLTFAGGWTHSATGAKGNGTTAFASTRIIPSIHLLQNSTHVSYYSRTNVSEASLSFGVSAGGASGGIDLYQKWTDTNAYGIVYGSVNLTVAAVNGANFSSLSRTASNLTTFYINGVSATSDNSASLTPSNIVLLMNARNTTGVTGFFSSRESAFASVGTGTDITDNSNLYNIVQAFNTALSRNN